MTYFRRPVAANPLKRVVNGLIAGGAVVSGHITPKLDNVAHNINGKYPGGRT